MKEQIENYLNLIFSEIKENQSNDFDINQKKFANYKIFDFVNFQLINKYILDENKKDFFISIPENDYRDNFFSSIFHSLVFIKLYQNFFNYEKTNPTLEKGDLIYSNSKKRVFEILTKSSQGLTIKYKFPKGKENGTNFTIQGHQFTKINPNLSNGRNTATNIDNYSQFLKDNFGDKFPFITDFKNRTLVIADQSFFKESKHLPIRYTNRNGKISNDLPFFNYLIECCNSFETAKNFLLDSNHFFDEIIVIADSKYSNNFDFILQETKFQGKVNNVILIGAKKPNTPNEFVEWLWSNDEIKLANNEISNIFQKITLENNELYSKLIAIKNEIEIIKSECQVNLSFLLKYLNFYFRIILVNSNLSKGIFKEYIERFNSFVKSDNFEEELNALFYDKNIYNSETIREYTNRIFDRFTSISETLEKENLKWNFIKQKAKEKNLFLIVEKRNYDAIQNQINNERIENVELISDKRIDSTKEYLDKWLNDDRNCENKTIIVPYLNDVSLFKKLKSIKGTCLILCYKEIDEISFDNIVNNYQVEEKSRLVHKDRLIFFKTDFAFTNEIKRRELDDVFNFDINSEQFRNNPYESIDLPREKNLYEITFSDGSSDKFDSTKGVFLIDNKELIKATIGEIYEGSTIRFYQNTNPKEFKKILNIFDTENLLNSFDIYSESWKETLNRLATKFNGIENLYDKIFDSSYKINYNTFRLYFDKNSQTRFPRIKTLEVIKDFCVANNLSNELIVSEFEKFKSYSKKDHSIRQQAGRILGSDLLDYIASNEKEVSDSLKKLSKEILDNLTATIQEKKVTKKKLLEDE